MDANEPVFPVRREPRRRATSAIPAGWICFGIGLATAWFFPPCHVFFSVALVLAVVAMATHQIETGLALLICTLLASASCAAVFIRLLLPAGLPPAPTPMAMIAYQPASVSAPSRPVAASPVDFQDVARMLRIGLSDDEILAEINQKQLVSLIGAAEAEQLRTLGAGQRLINRLQGQRVFAAPEPAMSRPAVVPVSAPFLAPPPVAAPAADPADRQRRIDDLKRQMDSLDDQIRELRVHSSPWPNYHGANVTDTQGRDTYIKQLDERRNALRREKWQLEGR